MSELLPEWAFYYPNPVWSQSNWLKNLLLFFDGVVMLAPEFARERPFEADSEIAQRLQDAGLLKVVELKSFVDSKGVRVVADALTELIAGGSLDQLAARPTEFHALSYSQLGYMTDGGLAEIIYEGLHARGVGAQGPQGTGSWHPTVRSLLLVLLAQVLRPAGRKQGMYLCPATDRRELHSALIEVIGLPSMASASHVVSLDLQPVGVDLTDVPIEDVLRYRDTHRDAYRRFTRDLRGFVHQTVDSPLEDQQASLLERQLRMTESAARILSAADREWDRPASFALGLTGAAWSLRPSDIIGGLLALGSDVAEPPGETPTRAGAFSYLFTDQLSAT